MGLVDGVLGTAGNLIGSAFGAIVPKDANLAAIKAAQGHFSKPDDNLLELAGSTVGGHGAPSCRTR
ncbi:hypothetical protein ACWGII_39675 [Streptomyces sp. NPDC054855]